MKKFLKYHEVMDKLKKTKKKYLNYLIYTQILNYIMETNFELYNGNKFVL